MKQTYRALLCAICLGGSGVGASGCSASDLGASDLGDSEPGAAATSAAAAENTLTPTQATEGWQLLFDGNSMARFRNYNATDINEHWVIDNQSMVLTKRGGGDLITRESWADFEFALDWWVAEGGNSGVFFLADESDLPIYVHAPEVQILDNKRHRDSKQADRRSGSLYDMIAAPPESQKPAESWNSLLIRHQAGHLQAWQNGVKTVDIQIGGPRWKELLDNSKFKTWPGFGENTSGHIGLQDHGDRVAFRNLKIRSLGTTQ